MKKETRKTLLKAIANCDMSITEIMMLFSTARVFIDYWNQFKLDDSYAHLMNYYENALNSLLKKYGLPVKAIDFVQS